MELKPTKHIVVNYNFTFAPIPFDTQEVWSLNQFICVFKRD